MAPTAGLQQRPSDRLARERKPPSKRALVIDKHAKWIMREYERDPRCTYNEMIARVRQRYGISGRQAQETYSRYRTMEKEALATLDLSSIVSRYEYLYECAVREKKWNAARSIVDSMAWATGVAKPPAIELQHSGQVSVQQLAHVSVLALTPTMRAQRIRELQAKTGPVLIDVAPAGEDVLDVDDDGAGSDGTNGHGTNGHGG
jgi:hypothetical protein